MLKNEDRSDGPWLNGESILLVFSFLIYIFHQICAFHKTYLFRQVNIMQEAGLASDIVMRNCLWAEHLLTQT